MKRSSESMSNKDRLLLTAIDLMALKGYKGVSTKEIASAAEVSEMTLFRNFGSKQNLLETAIERFYYAGEMKRVFDEELVSDLESDLLLISRRYQDSMNRNRKMIRIVLQEPELKPLRDQAQRHPRLLKELLTEYFDQMQREGRAARTDSEAAALSFMWMNYGAFMSSLFEADPITDGSMPELLENGISLFAKAMRP
ncbi:TetR/AcrR family transcriptional regulator [Paenibacillus sp. FSL M8-0142]|uniref:TetR/AcrR family transcriptional regulator n=1 Tax=Paenibacillus sp. FSL M8-0142 TaxID=2954525 RepID=UPI00315B1EE3